MFWDCIRWLLREDINHVFDFFFFKRRFLCTVVWKSSSYQKKEVKLCAAIHRDICVHFVLYTKCLCTVLELEYFCLYEKEWIQCLVTHRQTRYHVVCTTHFTMTLCFERVEPRSQGLLSLISGVEKHESKSSPGNEAGVSQQQVNKCAGVFITSWLWNILHSFLLLWLRYL